MQLPSLLRPLQKIAVRLKIYTFLLMLAVLIVIGLLLFTQFFSVHRIEIHGDTNENNPIGLDTLKNKNIIFLSTKEFEKIILDQNPTIATISITKKYPDALIIIIRSSSPLAYLKLNGGFALLDEKAKVLAKVKSTSLKLALINFYQLFDFQQMSIGDTLNYREITTTNYLLKKSQDLNLVVESIDINGLSMIVFNVKYPSTKEEGQPASRQVTILFNGEKDKEKQGFELETIIKRFKIEAKEFKALDFRFDKPVVSF